MSYIWNSLVFLFLGCIFGAIIFCALSAEGSPVIREVLDAAAYGLSNPYLITLMTTFVAAIAATMIVFLVEWWREKNTILAELNAARSVLCAHIDEILNLKVKYLLPHARQIELVRTQTVARMNAPVPSGQISWVTIVHQDYMVTLMPSSLKEFVSIESISKHAAIDPDLLRLVMSSKQSIDVVNEMVILRNNILDEFRLSGNTPENNFKILGLPIPNGNVIDARFYNTVNELVVSCDYALFFLYEAIRRIEKLSIRVLPKILSSKVKPLEFYGSELAKHMPDIKEYRKLIFGNKGL